MQNTALYQSGTTAWEQIPTDLPPKGLYYLDDRFVGYGMCDVVVCTEIPRPYTIPHQTTFSTVMQR